MNGLPYLVLVIAVGVTTWYQQKQIQGRSKNGASANPQQQAIMKILPFMLPVFSFGFPAALVLYWFASNLFRVGQQVFITKRIYGRVDDEVEIIRPDSVEKKGEKQAKTTKKDSSPARKGGSGGHGRRSPVSGPAPKKRKTPPAKNKSATKRSTPEKRERQERPTSKRVTPKKNAPAEPTPTRRRDRKKK